MPRSLEKKVWARPENVCLDFLKTLANQHIKSSKVAAFQICEIFSNSNISYVRGYKAALTGGNYRFTQFKR